MTETNPSRFCVNCGEPMAAATKFCVHCGTERAAAPAEEVPEPTPPPVAPPSAVASSPPPAAGAPSRSVRSPNRNRAIVAGVAVGLVIVAAAGFVWNRLSGSADNSAVAVAPVTPASVTAPAATSPVTQSSTTVTRKPSAPSTQSIVSQLDAKLNESAAQVGQLKAIIGQFDPATTGSSTRPCGLSGAAAATQIQPIIDGRKSMVDDLDGLATSAKGSSRQLVTALRTAINLSLQSDYAYRAWMTANATTDTTIPCRRVHDANWNSSQTIAPRAGDAKKAFLAAYLPIAAGLGVRSDWTYTDF